MLFITPASDTKQAKDYFTQHMERSDYYLKDSPEIAGQWHGLGAELMGLSGTVDKERYFALCDNRNPITGKQLTPHTKGNRRVLYDFTFDAPKSVSLAYELGGDDRILDAFRQAVRDTMGEMEASVMTRVRAGKRDETRASANMVWAEFIHRTTRPVDGLPEPQLHCHAAAFNMSFDPVEEKWKAAEFSNLVRDKGYYQAAFHSRLSENLRTLGYGIERDGNKLPAFRHRSADGQEILASLGNHRSGSATLRHHRCEGQGRAGTANPRRQGCKQPFHAGAAGGMERTSHGGRTGRARAVAPGPGKQFAGRGGGDGLRALALL
jgi:conjugative relaxase-like TrwC/TraI family protein